MILTLGLVLDSPDYALEIWAGDACELEASRVGPATTCWRLYAAPPNSLSNMPAFRVRDFLSGLTRAADPESADGDSGAACELQTAAPLPQFLTAYVLLIDSNGSAGGSATWRAEYRLVGSPPPDRVMAGVGDKQALIAFEYDDADTAVASVQFYCEPPPNDPDAIARGDLVSGDADAENQSCSESNELVAGRPAAALEHLRCGSAPIAERRGIADGLVNGVPYNIAVATVDRFGNVGTLSDPFCVAPQAKPVVDPNAKACSIAGTSPTRNGSALPLVAMLGSALVRRRLRARSKTTARHKRAIPFAFR
ncbi:MAG TPA: hypothetical protein VHM25_19085 [Polyangiaceae bacterium]|nr:hypothetical protein [Polyangiaceae bacterium]